MLKELLEGGLAKGALGGALRDYSLSLGFLFTPLNQSTPLRPRSHPLEAAFEARLVSVAVLVILVVVLLAILAALVVVLVVF